MGKIIEINRKHVNKEYINQLYKEISTITSDAEMTETEDGEILLDSISEMRINELETKIREHFGISKDKEKVETKKSE